MGRSPDVVSGQDIEREIPRFTAFASAYHGFLARFGDERIFTEQPPGDSCGCVAAHLAEGRYLLRAFSYEFDRGVCERAVSPLLDLFGEHLPADKDDLDRIRGAFSSGGLDAREFILTIFRNRGDAFLDFVRERGLEENLAIFFAVYLTRPFRVQAARHLCMDIEFSDWLKGYCPVCGHWPALAHADAEERSTLWCLGCGTLWPFPPQQCIYCDNADPSLLGVIGPENDPSLRVRVCHSCQEYLKEVRSDVPADAFPFDAYFLGTHALDRLARERGFVHKSALAVEADEDSSERHLVTHHMKMPWNHP